MTPETRAARAGAATDPAHRALAPPLTLAATFAHDGARGPGAYDYARTANPTRALLETTLADLEGGAGCAVTASGMAAMALALLPLPAGAHVVAQHDLYGGTWRLLDAHHRLGRLAVTFADLADPSALAAALARGAALVVLETPSNPCMRVYDVAATAAAAHGAGARLLVDNTFLSPVRMTPIALGADMVVHSTTKVLNGHSDVVGGALVAASPALAAEHQWWSNCAGAIGAPFDAYQTLRGLRTLHVRVARAEATAHTLAATARAHPAVAAVHWPGFADHPGHALAHAQASGPGTVFSLDLRDGLPAVHRLLDALRIVFVAQSLGGTETLAAHPATMTHRGMSPAARVAAGITDGLVRISVGLETAADLAADLTRALDACVAQ